jgi:DNA-binding transcriptional MerR regulator
MKRFYFQAGEKKFVKEKGWKIGELAKKTGLTVRMLHHYDRIGLFSPSGYTASGHRLYTLDDLKRLQQIVSLKQLGFRLKEIKSMMQNSDYDPAEMLRLQIDRLDGQIRALTRLKDQLQQLHDLYQKGIMGTVDQFMTVMRMMIMAQSPHFPAEQIEKLRKQYVEHGNKSHNDAAVRTLLDELRGLYLLGKSSDDRDVLAVARRWKREMEAIALTDPQLVQAAEQYYQEKPEDGQMFGLDKELYLFLRKALSRIK